MNVAQLIRRVARRSPASDAVVTDDGTASFADLWRAIAAAGQFYLDHGVGAGDRVLLILPNGEAFLHFHFGALKIGAVSVPVRADYTWWEVRRIAANCEPRLVVSTADWLARNQRPLQLDPRIAVHAIESLRAQMPPGDETIHAGGSSMLASINYSYFGHGYPKGAMLTHANHIYAATGYARHQGFRSDDRLFVSLPMCHVYALSGCVNAGLAAGAALVPSTQEMPRGILRSVERHRVTVLSLVPAMFECVAHYPRRVRFDLSSLRLLVTGGAYMPATQQRAFERALGAELVQGYGLTECLPIICNPPGDRNRHGTLGIPGRRDIFIRIVGSAGTPLPRNAVGEIQIRSTTTMRGYYRLPEDTRAMFDGDWLRTGDVGSLDEDGYLRFHGMTKPIFNVYGNKVDPMEVRHVLQEHPDVAEANVATARSRHADSLAGSARMIATVRPRPGVSITRAALRAFCADRLAGYKVPHAFVVEEACDDKLPGAACETEEAQERV